VLEEEEETRMSIPIDLAITARRAIPLAALRRRRAVEGKNTAA
jgi:hypothetical protein